MYRFTIRNAADLIGEELLEMKKRNRLLFNLSEDELDALFALIKRRSLTGTVNSFKREE
tara:strand:+ start:2004 stop:2180 length:177 start_codon:yes stop_codon:yes gene_type:complete